jgi:hypothetical protein
MAKAKHPPAHSFTLALPLSLVHLSLYTLSHTQARRGEGKEKGLKQGCSKRWPWRPLRSLHPQEVGVGRRRSPLTLATRRKQEGDFELSRGRSSCSIFLKSFASSRCNPWQGSNQDKPRISPCRSHNLGNVNLWPRFSLHSK